MELGAKSELFNGRVTTSFALYRIEDTNRAIADPAQPGFSIAAVRELGDQITPRWKTSLTVNNLLDRKYFDRPDSGWRQTYYGEPRNLMFTLSYRS